jgi:LPS sulfotransferase NodH
MFAKHTVYKFDNYNMLTVEVQGKTLVVREISTEWGEECHKFLSRPEMMHWAEKRFRPEDFPEGETQYREAMEKLRQI